MSSSSDESQVAPAQSNELKTLKKRRAIVKGKLTLFKKFLSGLSEVNITAEQLIELELRLERISQVFNEFETIQDHIETLSTDIDSQVTERETYQATFFSCVSLGKKLLQTKGEPAAGNNPDLTRQSIITPETCESIKFPEIPLPSFNGDITCWIEFRDTFDALINQSNLKNIQKYKYLRSCLKGNALEVIGSLEYSEESYRLAWQLLCERFNNPKILVNNHLRGLFLIDQVPSAPMALRGLIDNISKHLRTLKNLDIPIADWDILIIFFIIPKLEKSLQRKWEERISSRELPSLQDFKNFLRAQADLQEALASGASTESDTPAGPARSTLLTTSSSRSNSNPSVTKPFIPINQCPYCKEKHYINQCARFLALNAAARIRAVRNCKLCLNCLRAGHALPNCRASQCRECKGKHHTLLHITDTNNSHHQSGPSSHQPNTFNSQSHSENRARDEPSSFTNRPVSLPITGNLPNDLPTQTVVTNTTTSNINTEQPTKNKVVILSTAQVKVRDRYNQLQTLRILLDSGSQSNLITENACKKLGLELHSIAMEVMGFNESVTKVDNLCNIELESIDSKYSTKLSCLVVGTHYLQYT